MKDIKFSKPNLNKKDFDKCDEISNEHINEYYDLLRGFMINDVIEKAKFKSIQYIAAAYGEDAAYELMNFLNE